MSLKDLLVHIDATPHAAQRLALAVDLAQRHAAHLVGLYVTPPIYLPEPLSSSIDPVLFENWQAELRAQASQDAESSKAAFEETLRREAVSGEWRMVEGVLPQTITLHARYADLTIIGQANPDMPQTAEVEDAIEELLFSSGRPVLVVPYLGAPKSVGHRVLVGWNGTREAARALGDALVLMQPSSDITVITASAGDDEASHGMMPAMDISVHLARHGLHVTASHTVLDGMNGADVLLNQASDSNSDLLVVGGYGHSRLREWALGGVTRSLLRQTTVPVLMSR